MRGNEGVAGADALENRTAWTFLSNHAHVLACLAADPSIRLRDVAVAVGITERAAQSIVADLVGSGYVTRTRVGRRNSYAVDRRVTMKRDDAHHLEVGAMLDFLAAAHAAPHREVPVATAPYRGDARGNSQN